MNPTATLLNPRTVAIVGATEHTWQGSETYRNLVRHGFPGNVYPINPRYEVLFGQHCYPDISSAPADVDVAVVTLGAERSLKVLAECAEAGIRSAILFTDGFAESGPEGEGRQDRLRAIARESGMAICGPNSMGLVHARQRAPLWLGRLSRLSVQGRIGAIVQSGSVGIALLNAGRGLEFGYMISSGNEAVTTTADYLDLLVSDDSVEIIACHLETMNEGERFLSALERAHDMGKPVVVLKAGRSKAALRIIAGHTGSITGADFVARSVLKQRNAIVVSSLEQLIETLVLLSAARPPKGTRAGVVTVSGGLSGLCADLAAEAGLRCPEVLYSQDPADGVANFVDAWGNGAMEQTLPQVLPRAAIASNIDVLAVVHDLDPEPTSGRVDTARTIVTAACDAAKEAVTPVVWLVPTPKQCDAHSTALLAEARVPLLHGLLCGLGALAAVGRWSERTELEVRSPVTKPTERPGSQSMLLTEHESKSWLRAHRLPAPAGRLAHTEEEAVRLAADIGFPVVLKNQVVGVVHKTRLGFVRLGVASEPTLRANVRELLDAAARQPEGSFRGILIEEQVPDGAEAILSAFIDESFGHVVMLGFGGVASERLGPPVVRIAPVCAASAEAMIDQSGIGALLNTLSNAGREGARAELTRMIVDVSAIFDGDAAEQVRAVEINPVRLPLHGTRAVAVDALVETEASTG